MLANLKTTFNQKSPERVTSQQNLMGLGLHCGQNMNNFLSFPVGRFSWHRYACFPHPGSAQVGFFSVYKTGMGSYGCPHSVAAMCGRLSVGTCAPLILPPPWGSPASSQSALLPILLEKPQMVLASVLDKNERLLLSGKKASTKPCPPQKARPAGVGCLLHRP